MTKQVDEACSAPEQAPTTYSVVFPAALAFAHRALADSARRLRTAALTFRLGLAVAFAALVPLFLAHRVRCAAAILALVAALIFRRFLGASPATGLAVEPTNLLSLFSKASIFSLRLTTWCNCLTDRSAIELILLLRVLQP